MIKILISILFIPSICSSESVEDLIILPPTKSEIAILASYVSAHQLSYQSAEIGKILEPYVYESCNQIATIQYITNNISTTIDLQDALFSYYREYQIYLLQPMRNPNKVYEFINWHNVNKAEKNLRQQIKNHQKEIASKKSFKEECNINILTIQRMVKELVSIEKTKI